MTVTEEDLNAAMRRLRDCGALRIKRGGFNDACYTPLAASGHVYLFREGPNFRDVRLARNTTHTIHRPLPQEHGESGRAAPIVRPDRVSL